MQVLDHSKREQTSAVLVICLTVVNELLKHKRVVKFVHDVLAAGEKRDENGNWCVPTDIEDDSSARKD